MRTSCSTPNRTRHALTGRVDTAVARARGRRGVTLIELLVVLAIISALLGIGVGVFRGLVSPDRVAASQVHDALFAAQLFAQREQAPATVVIDPETALVVARGLRAVGNWHFEDDLGTGWPVAASHEPEDLDPQGALGSCLRLDDERVLTIAGLPASANSPHGFSVDVHVWPERDPRPMTLLERRGAWDIVIDRQDRLVVTLMLARDDGSDDAEEVSIAVGETIRWPHRFVRLTVSFDGSTLRVTLDGARLAEDTRFPAVRRLVVPSPGAPLFTGTGGTRFVGRLDELRLLSVVEADARELPGEVRLVGQRRELHLDPQGRLDPAYHQEPVVIGLLHGDPERRTDVEFGRWGAIRTLEPDS